MLAGATPAVARADGDPASDTLYTNSVFFPYTTTISRSAQNTLLMTVSNAKRAGYPIRVAVIGERNDLGAVQSLWAKPRQYASFLDAELSFLYTGPLLVVMPAGIGFAHLKHATGREYTLLQSVASEPGPDGLARTAGAAINALAAQAGHPIAPSAATPTSHHASQTVDLLVVGGAALLLISLFASVTTLARRRSGRNRNRPPR